MKKTTRSLRREIEANVAAIHARLAVERSEENTKLVRETIEKARHLKNGEITKRLRALCHFRSHSLEYLRGQKDNPPPPSKYGDEKGLLDDTVEIVELLYSTVNGTSYSLDEDVREMSVERSREFWENLTFRMP